MPTIDPPSSPLQKTLSQLSPEALLFDRTVQWIHHWRAYDTLASSQDAGQTSYSPLPPLSAQDQLTLYGLYKQATVGPLKRVTPMPTRPSLFQPTPRAKYDAWAALEDLEPKEAQWQYCSQVMSWCQGIPSLEDLQPFIDSLSPPQREALVALLNEMEAIQLDFERQGQMEQREEQQLEDRYATIEGSANSAVEGGGGATFKTPFDAEEEEDEEEEQDNIISNTNVMKNTMNSVTASTTTTLPHRLDAVVQMAKHVLDRLELLETRMQQTRPDSSPPRRRSWFWSLLLLLVSLVIWRKRMEWMPWMKILFQKWNILG